MEQFAVHPKGSLVPGPRLTLLSVDPFSGSVLSGQGRTWHEEISGLHRPVWLSLLDLDEDAEPDYILHEFGYETGRLSWYPSSHRDHKPIALYSGPGSIKSEVVDLDGDGRQEMVSLVAQGDEHVSAWIPVSGGHHRKKGF